MLPWDPLWRLRHVGYPVSPRGYRGLPAFASLSMAGSDGSASLGLAMSVVGYFELEEDKAQLIAAEVGRAVATWREEAARMGLTQAEIGRMASAFEHAYSTPT